MGSRRLKIALTRAKTHPIDSAASSFQRAGVKAAEDFLKQLGEPAVTKD
jgi:hypothetical protein